MPRTYRPTVHAALNIFVLLVLIAGLLAPTVVLAQEGATETPVTEVSAEPVSTEPPPVVDESSVDNPAVTEPPVVDTGPTVVTTESPDVISDDTGEIGADEVPPVQDDPAVLPTDESKAGDQSEKNAPSMSLAATDVSPVVGDINVVVECLTGTSLRVHGSLTLTGTSGWNSIAQNRAHIAVLRLEPDAGLIDAQTTGYTTADPAVVPFDFSWTFGDGEAGRQNLYLSVETSWQPIDESLGGQNDVHHTEPVFVGNCTGTAAPVATDVPTEVPTEEPTVPPTPTPYPSSSEILKDEEVGWFQAISLDCFGRLTYAYEVPEDTTAIAQLTGYWLNSGHYVGAPVRTTAWISVSAGSGTGWVQLSHSDPTREFGDFAYLVAWIAWPEPVMNMQPWNFEPARHEARIRVNDCLGIAGEAPEWIAPDVPWLTDDVPTEVPSEEPDEPGDTTVPTISSFTVNMSNPCAFLGGGNTVSGTLYLNKESPSSLDMARIEVFWEVPVSEGNPDGEAPWGSGHFGSVFFWSDQEISVNGPWSFSMPALNLELGGLFGYDRPEDAIALVFRASAGNWRWHAGGPAPDTQIIRYPLTDCGLAPEPSPTDPPVTPTEPVVTETPTVPATEPPVTEEPTEPSVTEEPTEPATEEPVVQGAAVPVSLALCANDTCTPPYRTDADGFIATWEFTKVAEARPGIRSFAQLAPETVTVTAVIQNGTATATTPTLAAGTWNACLQPVVTRADGATIRLFDAQQCETVTIAANGEVAAVESILPASVALAIVGGATDPVSPPDGNTTGSDDSVPSATGSGSSGGVTATSQQATTGLPVTGTGSGSDSSTMHNVLVLLAAATVLAGTALQVRRRP